MQYRFWQMQHAEQHQRFLAASPLQEPILLKFHCWMLSLRTWVVDFYYRTPNDSIGPGHWLLRAWALSHDLSLAAQDLSTVTWKPHSSRAVEWRLSGSGEGAQIPWWAVESIVTLFSMVKLTCLLSALCLQSSLHFSGCHIQAAWLQSSLSPRLAEPSSSELHSNYSALKKY